MCNERAWVSNEIDHGAGGTKHIKKTKEKECEECFAFAEAALWTKWVFRGDLIADSNVRVVDIDSEGFYRCVELYPSICKLALKCARRCAHELNAGWPPYSDQHSFQPKGREEDGTDEGTLESPDTHYIFLSHYKMQAGTEATLMAGELLKMIQEDLFNPACDHRHPVFIDSEALEDLKELRYHVAQTHNLVVLLTPGIFSRPWCLVEIVTAVRNGVAILPVEVQRLGLKFEYPTEEFYKQLSKGYLD